MWKYQWRLWPPGLHAMNATGSMTEKQLEEGEVDTVQLLYVYPGLTGSQCVGFVA